MPSAYRSGAAAMTMQRNVILGLLLAMAASSWWWLLRQPAGGGMAMASPTMGMRAPFFLAMWVIMMVAMMFPTAAPMIIAFHTVQATRRRRGETFVATWVFVVAYMLVWSLSGVFAYVGAVAAEAIGTRMMISSATAARIGAVMLIAAGAYQLTPLKDVCLAKCHTPMGFIVTSWRDGVGGALRMGLVHGIYCLGCCWLLFIVLFPLGIMNIAAMAVITLVVFGEKSLPWGRPIARATAASLVAYGVCVLIVPRTLPTFMAHGATVPAPIASPAGMMMPEGSLTSGQ